MACSCAHLSLGLAHAALSADAANVDTAIPATLLFTVQTPSVAATLQRGSDCQYQIRIDSIWRGNLQEPSRARAFVFATSKQPARKSAVKVRNPCSPVESGQYAARGTLEPAEFGSVPLWFTLDEDTAGSLTQVAPPSAVRSAVAHMRVAFLNMCQRSLSEQGRILVPGVTMGVLGQETMMMNAGDDGAAGKRIKENFKKSGIVHLLAVSGGHFVLLGELVRRLMGRCHMPRVPTAVGIGVAYVTLSMLMYPSDSVSRALVMGLMMSSAMVIGRPAQAMSALCWTVLGCLILDPGMARSFGFALSCAAVAGIVLFNGVIQRALISGLGMGAAHVRSFVRTAAPGLITLEQSVPKSLHERASRCVPWIAEAVAVTLSAQVFTLPIQLLMSTTIPMWSVFANICVAPFVTFSTFAGLAALATAWVIPPLGLVLVHMASCGTAVMSGFAEFFGTLCGGAWESSVSGVISSCIVGVAEAVVAVAVAVISRGVIKKIGHRIAHEWEAI
ncbi:MAG: ComEC/Rec2 family competence protein [Bifidobacteriaceae bacterium]|nr:ComEC/Rec2 family competence protein [Bifidobacteriaceae bacterium]